MHMETEWEWCGARWWKFDFHCHTPASLDYGKGPCQEDLRKISAKEWLLSYMRNNIDCVVVADHNTGAWVDKLVEAYSDLKINKHVDFRDIYIFPGVEITTQSNIHLLAIFQLGKSSSDIDTILGAVDYQGEKGSCEDCTVRSPIEVIQKVVSCGGVVVPAHVYGSKSLFNECSGPTLNQLIECKEIYAIEVSGEKCTWPQVCTDRKISWGEVLGSDSHHPTGGDGQSYPGSHYTWVKMSSPTLEGLKLALIDGNLSLKCSSKYAHDPNCYSPLAIERITVEDAKYIGRGGLFECKLNPWLNSIIGGRGTGKSTIIEFVRLCLNRDSGLPVTLEKDFAKYKTPFVKRGDDGLLTNKTKIILYYIKDGTRFRLIKNIENSRSVIEKEVSASSWEVVEGDVKDRFPAQIYSQKHIFELAKNSYYLLKVIDEAESVNFREWSSSYDKLTSHYFLICAKYREILSELKEEETVKGQLDDVKRKISVFERAGHAELLRNYQLRRNQDAEIKVWEDSWTPYAQEIKDTLGSFILPEIDAALFNPDDPDNSDLIKTVDDVKYEINLGLNDIRQVASKLDAIRETWVSLKQSLKISQDIDKAKQQYAQFVSDLEVAGAGNPDEYEKLISMKQCFEYKLKDFEDKKSSLEKVADEYRSCLIEIEEKRREITHLREQFLVKVLDGNKYVKIHVVPFGDKSQLESSVRALLDRTSGGFEKDIGSVDDNEGVLAILCNNATGNISSHISAFKKYISGIYSGDAEALKRVKDQRFAQHVKNLTPEKIDRLQCWYPDDALDIQYISKGSSYKPISQGSPGQKTAALLSFIMSYGTEPLILDQPEDDLDNQLIYELIVNQIREIKSGRQVVVVTHNANIVVNGDSENVVALDIRARGTKIVTQGCLQEYKVRDEICRIMEGGKDAFEKRYRRINAIK